MVLPSGARLGAWGGPQVREGGCGAQTARCEGGSSTGRGVQGHMEAAEHPQPQVPTYPHCRAAAAEELGPPRIPSARLCHRSASWGARVKGPPTCVPQVRQHADAHLLDLLGRWVPVNCQVGRTQGMRGVVRRGPERRAACGAGRRARSRRGHIAQRRSGRVPRRPRRPLQASAAHRAHTATCEGPSASNTLPRHAAFQRHSSLTPLCRGSCPRWPRSSGRSTQAPCGAEGPAVTYAQTGPWARCHVCHYAQTGL